MGDGQGAVCGTRQRAIAVARELFAERGYAGTSIADIADRLGVTKAAVYYHFRAKSDLLSELIAPMFTRMHDMLEPPLPQPRVLLERIVDLLAVERETIYLLAGDPSVMRELDACAPIEFFAKLVDALSGPRASASRRLRARCALGAVHAAVVGPMRDHCTPNSPGRPAHPSSARPMTAYERRVIVKAALAALG